MEVFEEAPDSWAYMFDPELASQYAGKFTMLNDMRETIGAALKYLLTGEEKDPDKIKTIKQQHERAKDDDGKIRHMIYFTVDRTRPLVGG